MYSNLLYIAYNEASFIKSGDLEIVKIMEVNKHKY